MFRTPWHQNLLSSQLLGDRAYFQIASTFVRQPIIMFFICLLLLYKVLSAPVQFESTFPPLPFFPPIFSSAIVAYLALTSSQYNLYSNGIISSVIIRHHSSTPESHPSLTFTSCDCFCRHQSLRIEEKFDPSVLFILSLFSPFWSRILSQAFCLRRRRWTTGLVQYQLLISACHCVCICGHFCSHSVGFIYSILSSNCAWI